MGLTRATCRTLPIRVYSVPEVLFILANSAGPDIIPFFVAINQSLQCLSKMFQVYKGLSYSHTRRILMCV